MNFIHSNEPAALLTLLSFVVGLNMVLAFRYLSNQEAIQTAKEHLKAHLLALRLFQDQLSIVVRSYGRIFLTIFQYLRLAFKPLLFIALPLALLLSQTGAYFDSRPISPGQDFLVKARLSDSGFLPNVNLLLPAGLAMTAPAVHIPSENAITWRVMAKQDGEYDLRIQAENKIFPMRVVVGSRLTRLSPVQSQRPLWKRLFSPGESALPDNAVVQSIQVEYPPRTIAFGGLAWDWIWLFLLLSLLSGVFFKTILRIKI